MEELKSLFGEGSLTFEQFSQKLGEAGETIKLANLKSGKYVSKSKYDKAVKSVEKFKVGFEEASKNNKVDNKLQSNYDKLQKEYNTLKEKQDQAEKMNLLSGANVNPDFNEFIYTKVNSMVNDGKDFKTCLDEYLGEHKQYLKTSNGSFVNLEGGRTPEKTENQKINEQIRKMRG